MELENVTAEIRPRSSWESADLGCSMVRENFFQLMKQWLCTVLPLQLIIIVAFAQLNLIGWGIFVIWWFKPLYDRVPLYFLSHSLFGEKLVLKQIFRMLPRLWTRRAIWALTLGRFSPSRSFTLPVSELEGLRGKPYRQRVQLLSRHGDGIAMQVMGVCSLLEFVLAFAFVGLCYGMVPEALKPRFEGFAENIFSFDGEVPGSFYLIFLAFYLPAMLLIELFYVGAGFGLYVNSRTITEGWDIELAFKRLRDRLRGGAGKIVAALVVGFSLFFSFEGHAENSFDPSVAKDEITDILSHEDFEVKTQVVQVPKESDSGEKSGFWKWLEELFEGWFSGSSSSSSSSSSSGGIFELLTALGYGFAVLLIVALGYLIYINRHIFGFGLGHKRSEIEEETKTKTVVGLDVTPESLPEDLLSAVRRYWSAGNAHEALSLLYRGSISHVIENDGVEIEESDTEYDCVRRVKKGSKLPKAQYFTELTHVWVCQAYGKQDPDEVTMERLITAWPFENHAASKFKKGAA